MSATSRHAMVSPFQGRITRLLSASAEGSRAAFDELIPLVYEDLRQIARSKLRSEQMHHTLDTTAVVHEAYLRLLGHRETEWANRTHFFAVAARVMRNVLVDHARRRGAQKRGGDQVRVTVREGMDGGAPEIIDLLALDEALTRLARHDPRLERVVECRFFAGMTMQETADAMDASLRTTEREWRRARAYLFHALRGDEAVTEGQPSGSGHRPPHTDGEK